MSQETPEKRSYTFRKQERLTRKSAFEYLFQHGSSFRAGVLKIFFIIDMPGELVNAPLSVAFAVPKKRFKRAVDRNLLRRRLKEAFRLNKHILLPGLQLKDRNLVFLIKYNSGHIKPYPDLEKALRFAFYKMKKEI